MKKMLITLFLFLITMSVVFAETDNTLIPVIADSSDLIIGEFNYCGIESIEVKDAPNDDGTALLIRWKKSKDVEEFEGTYSLYRINVETGKERCIKELITDETEFTDQGLYRDIVYKYYIVAVNLDLQFSSVKTYTDEITTIPNWFKKDKIILLLMIIVYTLMIVLLVHTVRKGKKLFLRRLAGIDALDEAVGRATEMGKPILYVPGLSSMSDIATIASLNILGPVAKKVAEYESRIIVPNRDAIVMTVAKEIVKEAFAEAGKPDNYDDNDVFFLTDSQFGFAAAVNGIMVREKPATNLFLGMFWAESLLLAETGNTTGAIQIAGTDAVTQLPFFITSCDYTLIGEELYAASAYLSNEPVLMGSIKAQDYMKAIIICFMLLFSIVFLTNGIINLFTDANIGFFDGIMNVIRFVFNT